MSWLYETGSVTDTGYDDFYKKMDITIMGSKTFSAIEKLENRDSIYSTTKNYVFSTSKIISSEAFEVVSSDIVEFISHLPKDKNVWLVGGNKILKPLLDADMVDTMTLQIAPVLLGNGILLFTQDEGVKRFDLLELNQYGEFSELVLQRHDNK